MVEADGRGTDRTGRHEPREAARRGAGLFGRLLDWLHRRWRPVGELLLLLWYCRVAALAVGVCGVALLINDQAQDALTQLALPDVRTLGFHAALWLLGLAAWYMSRVRLDLEPARRRSLRRKDPAAERAAMSSEFLSIAVPRAVGLAIFLLAAAALLEASAGRVALVVLGEAAGFFVFVYSRVKILRGLQARRRLPRFMAQAVPVREAGATVGGRGAPPDSVDALFRSTKIVLLVMVALSMGLALLTGLRPVWTAQWFNPLAMAMTGAASIVIFAGMIAYIGDAKGVPILGTLMVVAMTTTLIANPADRVTAVPPVEATSDGARLATGRGDPLGRPTLRMALAHWLAQRGHTPQSCRNEDYVQPILLVATAGGGSRAGYWTSIVLLHLSADPLFRDALFSISGVSGGSIGAAFFAGLNGAPATIDEKLAAARSFFSQDFLTPVIGAALFSDLMRRFAVVPLGFTNREGAIEKAFAAAWREAAPAGAGTDWESPFLELWRRAGGASTPALFLNGTVVETGQRFVVSNIALDPAVPHADISRVPQFPDAHDALVRIGGDPGLARAVSLSYRFPYVLPTAEIADGDRSWGHVVDGGYFENFGATTTLDLLRAIRSSSLPCLHPIVVQISSDPDLDGRSIYGTQAPAAAMRWALELRAPISTLLATRSARGIYATSLLREEMGAADFFHFRLCRGAGSAPLGFALSKSAVAVIEATWRAGTADPCEAGLAEDGLEERLKSMAATP